MVEKTKRRNETITNWFPVLKHWPGRLMVRTTALQVVNLSSILGRATKKEIKNATYYVLIVIENYIMKTENPKKILFAFIILTCIIWGFIIAWPAALLVLIGCTLADITK